MKWFSKKKLFPDKKWKLIDPEGRIADIEVGPFEPKSNMNNVRYSQGWRWVEDKE